MAQSLQSLMNVQDSHETAVALLCAVQENNQSLIYPSAPIASLLIQDE